MMPINRPGTDRSRILLVEGVPGIGKSTVLDRILRGYVSSREQRKLRTVLSLTQAHTYGPLAMGEDDGTLTAAECVGHLERIVGWVEWLARTVQNEVHTKSFILIDTLHITHCLRPGVVQWQDVIGFDQRLAKLGCKLLLLDAADETICSRTVTARLHTQFIQEYALGRFGRDEQDLVRHFQEERDAFRQMFADSSMLKMMLAAEASAEELSSTASAFWLSP